MLNGLSDKCHSDFIDLYMGTNLLKVLGWSSITSESSSVMMIAYKQWLNVITNAIGKSVCSN